MITATVLVLRAMARRWRDEEIDESDVPYGRLEEDGEVSERGVHLDHVLRVDAETLRGEAMAALIPRSV